MMVPKICHTYDIHTYIQIGHGKVFCSGRIRNLKRMLNWDWSSKLLCQGWLAWLKVQRSKAELLCEKFDFKPRSTCFFSHRWNSRELFGKVLKRAQWGKTKTFWDVWCSTKLCAVLLSCIEIQKLHYLGEIASYTLNCSVHLKLKCVV